jgi:hypothetical protein
VASGRTRATARRTSGAHRETLEGTAGSLTFVVCALASGRADAVAAWRTLCLKRRGRKQHAEANAHPTVSLRAHSRAADAAARLPSQHRRGARPKQARGADRGGQKEGKVVWYTSVDLPVAERVAKAFEAKYPGIAMRVERSGAERVYQRIGQEYGSKIYAVDCVNSSDAAHLIVWKRDGLLAPFVPEDVALHYPAEHKDPDGLFATWRTTLSTVGYNTKLVAAADAPKSFADLLDPKWSGKIVKAHPGYSGTIMTATFQIARDLGGDFEKPARR